MTKCQFIYNMNYKPVLHANEIIQYISSINDSIDIEFFESYLIDEFGQDVTAKLQMVSIDLIKPSPASNNHLIDNKAQSKYNHSNDDFSPILIDQNYVIIDGHHRYRASLFQKKTSLLCYILFVK